MSNENSNTNRPPYKNKGGSGRYRKFSCITYLDVEFLKLRLFQHEKQIRAYAYAYHDKDTNEDGALKEPHIHLLIITYNTCTISAIRRWFSGFIQNGKDVNTIVQKLTDEFEKAETHRIKIVKLTENFNMISLYVRLTTRYIGRLMNKALGIMFNWLVKCY